MRWAVGVWAAAGPLAFLVDPNGLGMALTIAVSGLIWATWIVIVLKTRLINLGWGKHFLLALGWCFIGLLRASVLIA